MTSFIKHNILFLFVFSILFQNLLHAKNVEIKYNQSNTTKIINGTDAKKDDWPWMAALIFSDYMSYNRFCGGSLIHPEWVLTAAHCVETKDASDIDVVLDIVDIKFDTGQRTGIKEIIIHPQYDDYLLDNDIALLRLEKPSNISCIPLISGQYEIEAKEATIMGWGSINKHYSEYPDLLQQVSVPIITNEVCKRAYSDEEITQNMFCAGYSGGGKDSCFGDSGGPVIIQESGKWKLAGIVSWGEGCGEPGYYGVYTRISKLFNFIFENVPLAALSLNIPDSTDENSGVLINKGNIKINFALDEKLLININSDNTKKVQVPDVIEIPSKSTSASFNLNIINNTIIEKNIMVNISANAQGWGITTASILINNDDKCIFQFIKDSYEINEQEKSIYTTIMKKNKCNGTYFIDYSTEDITAFSGSDYISASGNLIFHENEFFKPIKINIIDDNFEENIEKIAVKLNTDDADVSLGDISSTIITINDDDQYRKYKAWETTISAESDIKEGQYKCFINIGLGLNEAKIPLPPSPPEYTCSLFINSPDWSSRLQGYILKADPEINKYTWTITVKPKGNYGNPFIESSAYISWNPDTFPENGKFIFYEDWKGQNILISDMRKINNFVVTGKKDELFYYRIVFIEHTIKDAVIILKLLSNINISEELDSFNIIYDINRDKKIGIQELNHIFKRIFW